jgi:hypothetical protein
MRTGIGNSDLADSRLAGANAARDALAQLGDGRPELIFAYASVRYDLPAVVSAINEATDGAPLVGASASGQIHDGELTGPEPSVSVLALSGAGYRFGVGYADAAAADPIKAGRDLARSARAAAGPQRSPHEALVLMSDGLMPGQQELLNGVYRVTGFAVPVVGGTAGDDRQLNKTFVFCGDRVLTDAAVAVWIGSEKPMHVVSGHGWAPTGLPMVVTSVDGTHVREIAGRPALEVYQENFRYENPELEMKDERASGYHSAHAFGVIQPDGSVLIRAAFVDAEGDLRTFTPLPPFAAVQVVSSRADDLLDVGADTISAAVSENDLDVVLVFSCVARYDILGDRSHEEPRRLQDAARGARTFGFYTYGEFARTTSVAGYHNATVAALAL